jgi:hypothetical protein
LRYSSFNLGVWDRFMHDICVLSDARLSLTVTTHNLGLKCYFWLWFSGVGEVKHGERYNAEKLANRAFHKICV